jgi:excisionase family DNA binding protein
MTYIPAGNYLTKKEIAERCEVIHQTVQQWISRGYLPALDIPGLGYIVNEADLIEFMKKDRPRGYPKGKPRK